MLSEVFLKTTFKIETSGITGSGPMTFQWNPGRFELKRCVIEYLLLADEMFRYY